MKHQTLTSARPACRGVFEEAGGKTDVVPAEERSGGSAFARGGFFFWGGGSKKALAECTRSLAVLVGARMPLVRALQAASEQTGDRVVRRAFSAVRRDVEGGLSLSDSLARRPAVFSPLYVHLTRVGETTGGLGEVLRRLARYLERAHTVKRKVRLAMIYPGLIAVVAIGAVSFMLAIIVPTFAEMFRDFGAELPAATRYLMGASEALVANGVWVLVGVLATGLATRAILQTPRGRWWWDGVLLRLPIIGGVRRKSLAARFGRTLGTLLERGVPLTEAMVLLAASAENARARAHIDSMQEAVRRGEALSSELGSGEVFPPLMGQMMRVGEETARLDEMLLHVAHLYEEELDEAVDTLTSIIEPVLILIIGILLGGILIALYLPMFDLVTAVR